MAEKPPSTDNSTPFTKLESSEGRNNATVAISSGRPIFPRGDQGFEHLPRLLVESLGIRCVDLTRAQHVHPDIPALQFVEPRACELALGSESAWEGAAFEMPQPGDPS